MVAFFQTLKANKHFYQTPLFHIQVTFSKTYTKFDMQITGNQMHTGTMPFAKHILSKLLPTILKSKCFNEKNIPFQQEVLRTEIGHLFEHILLEYLCQLRLLSGYVEAEYSGTTDWDWTKENRGIFHIITNASKVDSDILPKAIEKSIALTYLIYSFHEKGFNANNLKTLEASLIQTPIGIKPSIFLP